MNYIMLVNTFWEIRRERSDFDPYVISLYFALVNFANRNAWAGFSLYREDIIGLAGMSKNPYYKAREILKDAGLIEYEEGANGVSKCYFTVLEVSLKRTQQGHSKDTEGTAIGTILNKPINLKTTKPINTKVLDLTEKEKSFLDFFNSTCKRQFTSLPEKAKKQLCNLHKNNYTDQDLTKAVLDGYQDSLGWTDPSKFTPEYLTRLDNFQRYLFADNARKGQPAANTAVPKSINKNLSEQTKKTYI